jgi:hypothetical protein
LFYFQENQDDLDSKWKDLFPEDEEKLLNLDEDSISDLLDGVKHYNVNIPVAEVLNRYFNRRRVQEESFTRVMSTALIIE